MNIKSVFPVFLASLLYLASSASAIDFDSRIITSYELHEINDVNILPNPAFSPTLNCYWPTLGGVNDVPEATDGDYVFKLQWTNEPDKKVEVKHIWSNSTFDLIGIDYILIDVYFETASALPAINRNNISVWSKWDSNEHWISCESVPPNTGEWYTVGFYAGNLNYEDVNHIDAITFENMTGTSGTIYLDNLRLLKLPAGMDWPHIGRKIKFSEYWWSLLHSDYPIGAGPNYYTDEPNDIWVDRYGYAHLNISYKDPNWHCSELIGNANLGYGQYIFTIKAREVPLDHNIVLGLFVYDVPDTNNKPREIDFELSRWWEANEPNNAQYVVQPWDGPNNRYRFHMDEQKSTTHEIIWTPQRIDFRSYYGNYPLSNSNNLIDSWSYEGDDIPKAGEENPRINFYLLPPKNSPDGTPGAPPSDGREAEVIIKEFRYLPIPGDLNNDKAVNLRDFAVMADNWLIGAE
jgi:hypothetical protein